MLRILLGCVDGPVRSQIGTFLTALHVISTQLRFVADGNRAAGSDPGALWWHVRPLFIAYNRWVGGGGVRGAGVQQRVACAVCVVL